MNTFDALSERIGIRRPTLADCDEFIALAQASESLHLPWVDPPKTHQRFEAYLRNRPSPTDDGFLICDRASNRIAGVINLNCIVRGFFRSTYLGYYVFAGFERRGYMREGLKLVAQFAFTQMGLHRLEANVQPGNAASLALVRACGFRKEGFSPRYLQVLGEWRDHERWALLAEDFCYDSSQ
jgi:ribosomal-protein-alanine N-acetyltransferase